MKQLHYILIGLVAMLLLMPACSVKRKAVKQETTPVVEPVQPKVQTFKALPVSFTVNYAERTIAANGSIQLVADSAIVISVQPLLGIELLRAEIDLQQVRVIDKMNRRYLRVTYSELSLYTGMDIQYADIEKLILEQRAELTIPGISCKIDYGQSVVLNEDVNVKTLPLDQYQQVNLRTILQ